LLLSHQEVHRDTAADFEAFMLDSMEREWAADKARLAAGLGQAVGTFGAPRPATPAPGGAAATPAAAAPGASPFDLAAGGGAGGAAGAAAAARAEKYFEAVKAINAARQRGAPVDAAAALRDAAASAAALPAGAPAAASGATLPEFWHALSCVLSGGGGEAALVAGSLRYLEDGHVRYMRAVVARDVAAGGGGGGSGGRRALVDAFLRCKLRGSGPLDIDAGSGGGGAVVDTAWQGAYLCFRSGLLPEAAAAAQAAAARSGGHDVASALGELAGPAGRVSAGGAARAADDAARALSEPPSRPGRAHRAALGAALAGDARLGDMLHAACPELFATIEDFLWHKLQLVRAGTARPPSAGASPDALAAGLLAPYGLADLQAYLSRFEPAHFAKGGREPLLAAAVMALAARFAALLDFLSRDPLAEGHGLDGVHAAAALAVAGAAGGAGGESGSAVGGAAASLLAAYARQLAPAWPLHAAEYMALAAAAGSAAGRASGSGAADEETLLDALLRELLRHPGAAAALLGGPAAAGVDGELARFVPDASRRRRLVAAAGAECAAAGLLEQGVELHRRAGEPAAALALLNRKLADALAAGGTGATAAAPSPAFEAARKQGAPLDAAARAAGARAEPAHFAALVATEALLRAARAGDAATVLLALLHAPELAFVPLDPRRVAAATQQLDELHPGVAARLPDVLVAAAGAVAAPGAAAALGGDAPRRAAMAALAELATAARFRIPPHVCAQIARLATAPLA
jgi:hypothetical protein